MNDVVTLTQRLAVLCEAIDPEFMKSVEFDVGFDIMSRQMLIKMKKYVWEEVLTETKLIVPKSRREQQYILKHSVSYPSLLIPRHKPVYKFDARKDWEY